MEARDTRGTLGRGAYNANVCIAQERLNPVYLHGEEEKKRPLREKSPWRLCSYIGVLCLSNLGLFVASAHLHGRPGTAAAASSDRVSVCDSAERGGRAGIPKQTSPQSASAGVKRRR